MSRLLIAVAGLLAVCSLLDPGALRAEDRGLNALSQTASVPNSGRVVSIGGSVTEIIYALGLSDRIVAVDSTSRHPREAGSKPNVGYMRQLAAEPILALEPSLILAEEDSGPPEVLNQLREANLPVVLIPDDPSPTGVLDKIARVAAALGVQEKGEALRVQLESQLKALATAVASLHERPRVLFLLSVGGGGAPLAAGRKTSAAEIIGLSGGLNAVNEFEDYKPLSPEAAVAAAPDFILVTDRSLGLLGGEAGLLNIPEIALSPAGKNRRIVAMDGLLLLGFGPRTGVAIEQLARHLHPDVILRVSAQ